MHILKQIAAFTRAATLVFVLGIAGAGGLTAVAHAAGEMDMMDACATACMAQQNPAVIAREQRKLTENEREAEPQDYSQPYYVAFQVPYTPQKLTALDPIRSSTFRPPDIVLRNHTLRF